MTSAENSISEPPNLKILWGRILTPRPPYKAFAFGTLDNAHHLPPVTKNLATALKSVLS